MMKYILTYLILPLLILSYIGCGKPPAPSAEIYYPPPPNKPYIKYVKTLYGEENLKRSFFGSIRDFLFGKSAGYRIGKPYGTYYDGKSKLYIVDTIKKGIIVMDFSSGKTKFFSSLGKFGELAEPVYLIIDKKGYIYVSDTKLKKVAVFDSDYNFSHFIGDDSTFAGPVGMAFNKDESKLYVVDSQDHNVKVFNRAGKQIQVIGKRGDALGEFYFPLTVKVNDGDTVYIVDSFHFAVQAMSAEGDYLYSFGHYEKSMGTMARPRDIAFDSDGNIYITDALRNNIQIYNKAGELLLRFGNNGVGEGEFRLPAGISIDNNDYIYIADSINERIQVFKYLADNNENN